MNKSGLESKFYYMYHIYFLDRIKYLKSLLSEI